jgi:hypothetical protein
MLVADLPFSRRVSTKLIASPYGVSRKCTSIIGARYVPAAGGGGGGLGGLGGGGFGGRGGSMEQFTSSRAAASFVLCHEAHHRIGLARRNVDAEHHKHEK